MRLPEYTNAELYNSKEPLYNVKKYVLITILKCIIFIALCALIGYCTYLIFLCCKTNDENYKFTSISIGAALITFLSAVIAIFCIFDNVSNKAFEDNLDIIERKYLGGRKLASWTFLKRSSYFLKKSEFNYYVSSAYFTITYGENGQNSAQVIIPSLTADMTFVSSIKRLIMLSKIIPQYKQYILDISLKIAAQDTEKGKNEPMEYYILLDILATMNRNILLRKIIKFVIAICFLFIVSAILFTVLFACKVF